MPKKLFTKENAKDMQLKGAARRKENNAAGRDKVSDFVNKDMVNLLFVVPLDQALVRLAQPKTIAEQIVASRMANDKLNWEMLNDVMDRVIGKPKQAIEAQVNADLQINLDTTGLYGDSK